MKTIQGMLAQYFVMRFGDKIHIEFVSSANKLKCFPKDNNTENVNNYKKHKTDAVYYTKKILQKNTSINCSNEDGTWIDSLVSKKKDDLCDSFLQGIINHPEYNKLIYKFVEFKKWKIQTINEIKLKMTNIKKTTEQFAFSNEVDGTERT